MTVQEALDLIKQVPLYRYECELEKGRQSDLFKALNTAIESMEKQVSIDRILERLEDNAMWKDFMIYDLTHREREIIRKAIEIIKEEVQHD